VWQEYKGEEKEESRFEVVIVDDDVSVVPDATGTAALPVQTTNPMDSIAFRCVQSR
jgi:hypothetical protein